MPQAPTTVARPEAPGRSRRVAIGAGSLAVLLGALEHVANGAIGAVDEPRLDGFHLDAVRHGDRLPR
jgi:hypothetical protein